MKTTGSPLSMPPMSDSTTAASISICERSAATVKNLATDLRGLDGLADFDVAAQDHAIDRRADLGALELGDANPARWRAPSRGRRGRTSARLLRSCTCELGVLVGLLGLFHRLRRGGAFGVEHLGALEGLALRRRGRAWRAIDRGAASCRRRPATAAARARFWSSVFWNVSGSTWARTWSFFTMSLKST